MARDEELTVLAVEVAERAQDLAGFLAGDADLPAEVAARLAVAPGQARQAREMAESDLAEAGPAG
jgi:hypothetical protein